MQIASKTLQAIVDALNKDGGAKFRTLEAQVLPHLGDAYSDKEDDFRSHLGASIVGGDCERAIWYGFRWAHKGRAKGKASESDESGFARMVRLWNRGHLEEGRFIALLLMIGVQVYQQDERGNQFRVSFHGGHMGGSGDGVLVGVPDLPQDVPCLGEFKTHSDDSFEKLKANGVQKSKPEHFVQMQTYMKGMNLAFALYMAVNKNTDELHAEIVEADACVGQWAVDRGGRIIHATVPPSRMRSASPTFWKCRYGCDMAPVCWRTVDPARNCRTCEHVQFRDDGCVHCNAGAGTRDKAEQLAGCELYTQAKILRDG